MISKKEPWSKKPLCQDPFTADPGNKTRNTREGSEHVFQPSCADSSERCFFCPTEGSATREHLENGGPRSEREPGTVLSSRRARAIPRVKLYSQAAGRSRLEEPVFSLMAVKCNVSVQTSLHQACTRLAETSQLQAIVYEGGLF